MDQHLGTSITLSFGLVFFFAVILYQPDHTPLPRAGPEVLPAKAERAARTPPTPVPELSPAEPLPVQPARAAIGPEAGASEATASADVRVKPAPPIRRPASRKVPALRKAPVLPPSEGFTQTLEGETLRDVAIRVYGSSDEAESLWRLNRDLIPRREGAVRAGTLLRTP